MNEKPKSIWKKSWTGLHWLRAWLIVVAATFFTVLIVTLFIPGRPRNLSDWWPALVFTLLVSVVVATVFAGLLTFIRCFFCWRNFKRLLFDSACLATLIALFYAEEDWRGWHAWQQFKRAWEAKGEHFDLASAVPPPVPYEQNFAMTPITFTSYGYLLTRDGKVIPPEKRDPNFAVRMRMPIAHDNNIPTNCAGDRVKGTFARLDNWQSYYRNLAAKTNEFPVPAQPQSPANDVLLALGKYDSVIEELRAASQLPDSRFPIDYYNESPWSILLPHLAPLKSCAQVLQLRSVAELQNGQPDRTLEDVRLALQLTDKVRNEPILISHLVRLAMVQLMLQPIWEGLAAHKWSDAQLVALDAELARLDFLAAYRLGMHGELGGQTGEMDLLRRHPEKLQDLAGLTGLDGGKIGPSLPGGFIVHLIPAGWLYQNEYRCAHMMVNYYLPLADVSRGTFSPDLARRGDAALATETKAASLFNLYERLMLPTLGNAARKFAYGQESVDLARVAIALERYRLAHGEFPESLDALAPQFIAKLPHDIINGQPLHYRRTSDGQFVLYSVGWNETDDGGEVGLTKNGNVDINTGDWVWRYPAK
jgi:hypothetical protein